MHERVAVEAGVSPCGVAVAAVADCGLLLNALLATARLPRDLPIRIATLTRFALEFV
jgi:hypothetical protein